MSKQPDGFDLAIQWPMNPFEVPQPVNQIAVQVASPNVPDGQKPDSYQVNFGFVQSPVILGDLTEELATELAAQAIPVATVGKFTFTRDRLVELRNILNSVIEGS